MHNNVKKPTKLKLPIKFTYKSTIREGPNIGKSLSKFLVHDVSQRFLSFADVHVTQL